MAATVAVAVAAAGEEEKSNSIQAQLTIPILLADRLINSYSSHHQEEAEAEAESFDLSLQGQATQLSQLLRAVARLNANQSLYDRPIRRITSDVTKTLDRALTLVRKRKNNKSNIIRQVFSINTTSDFRKVSLLLDNSLADIKWLLSVFDSDSDSGGGLVLSLPPIASNDPILAWVWSYIASMQTGLLLKHRIHAAQELSSLAQLNDRTKNTIIEENGIPPLLKLLTETTSPDAQIASATALYHLADDQGRARLIADELGIQTIVKALNESPPPPLRVQVALVKLVSQLADSDGDLKEEFGSENVTRALVTLLGMDDNNEGKKLFDHPRRNVTSLHSLVGVAKNETSSSNRFKHEEEVESPQVKMQLKVNCAMALWKLAKGSLLNTRKITETKALLCLAKIIDKEKGELQIHCLNTVMELAVIAEVTPDVRTAFKLNSPAARALLDQLLRVLHNESRGVFLIPCIKAIGCLARTFSAKETRRVIEPLVAQLGHRDHDIATQAVIALEKFVNPDNFNCVDHSKAIVEFNGVVKLMKLLRVNGRNQSHEFLLLCYLAVHVGNNKAFEEARALSVLEGAAPYVVPYHPNLRDLFAKAIHHLALYQPAGGTHSHIIQIDR